MISQVLFTSEQPKKNKMAFVGILSQLKLLFGPLVIQLVWYILKQLFSSVSVKVFSTNHNSLLGIATNEIASFLIDRSRQMAFFVQRRAKAGQKAGFRVMLKYFEIKKAFRYYIKQIDYMLPCV